MASLSRLTALFLLKHQIEMITILIIKPNLLSTKMASLSCLGDLFLDETPDALNTNFMHKGSLHFYFAEFCPET